MSWDAILALDEQLLCSLDRSWAEARARAGKALACRPGCAACCTGPFPITALDAWRLQRGLRELGAGDPERGAANLARAREAWERMSDDFPGDPASGLLGDDEPARERFFERRAELPCPALDPATGRCDLYAWRPVSCRTHGAPVRFGEARLPPCPLCFRGATGEEIEACRMVRDPEDLEGELLESLAHERGRRGETVVALALLRTGEASSDSDG